MTDHKKEPMQDVGFQQLSDALSTSYRIFRWIFLLFVVGFLFSGVHFVEPGHEAYVMRLGSWVNKKELPGLHFAFPFLVDRVFTFNTSSLRRLDVNDFHPDKFQSIGTPSQQYLLTREGHVIHMKWNFTYSLTDPRLAHSQVGEGNLGFEKKILANLFSGVLLRSTTRYTVDELLNQSDRFKEDVIQALKSDLSQLKLGYGISRVDLVEIQVPDQVKFSFDDVQKASASRENLRSLALTEASRLDASILAKREEILGGARSQAVSIRTNLNAEAMIVKKLLAFDEKTKKSFIRLKLQDSLKRAFENNNEQTYLLRENNELRIKLGPDPLIKKIRRQKEKQRGLQ